MAHEPYNPLDKRRLGESVAKALLARPVVALPPAEPFVGAGIYALYYTGSFPAYRKIAERNASDQWAAPIYVGKAVPPGARKGGFGNHDPGAGRYNQQRSPWDVIHPGRPWAARLKPSSRSKAEILKSLSESLE